MTTTTPLISVIVPCYNYGHLIHETLNSLVNQTYANWECIIVDDGSTDNTRDVSAGYLRGDSRFKYIYQDNTGLAGARNTGLKAATGEYIQFLDADDLLTNEKIERHLAVLMEKPDVDLVYGRVYVFEKHISEIYRAHEIVLQPKASGKGQIILDSLLEDNIFLVHCALFRSTIVGQTELFKEDMVTCEDWHFWFRLALRGSYFFFFDDDQSKVYVRDHGRNMSINRRNMWRGRIMFRQELERLVRSSGETYFQEIRNKNSERLLTLKRRYELAYGNILTGATHTVRSLFFYRNYYGTLRDTLYWIKERILFRV